MSLIESMLPRFLPPFLAAQKIKIELSRAEFDS